jgi:hypothetical protein
MQSSSSGKATIVFASQEIPNISWNPKVNLRVYTCTQLAPALSHMNPVNIIPSYFNIFLPPASNSSYWCHSFCTSHQIRACIPFLLHEGCIAPCSSHFILLGFIVIITFNEDYYVMKFCITQFSPTSHHLILHQPQPLELSSQITTVYVFPLISMIIKNKHRGP